MTKRLDNLYMKTIHLDPDQISEASHFSVPSLSISERSDPSSTSSSRPSWATPSLPSSSSGPSSCGDQSSNGSSIHQSSSGSSTAKLSPNSSEVSHLSSDGSGSGGQTSSNGSGTIKLSPNQADDSLSSNGSRSGGRSSSSGSSCVKLTPCQADDGNLSSHGSRSGGRSSSSGPSCIKVTPYQADVSVFSNESDSGGCKVSNESDDQPSVGVLSDLGNVPRRTSKKKLDLKELPGPTPKKLKLDHQETKRLTVFLSSLKKLRKKEEFNVGRILGASSFPHVDYIQDAFNAIIPRVNADFRKAFPEHENPAFPINDNEVEKGHVDGGEKDHVDGGEKDHVDGGEKDHVDGGEKVHVLDACLPSKKLEMKQCPDPESKEKKLDYEERKRLTVFLNSLKQLQKKEKFLVAEILGGSMFPHTDQIEDAFNVIKPHVSGAFATAFPDKVSVDDENKMFHIEMEISVDD